MPHSWQRSRVKSSPAGQGRGSRGSSFPWRPVAAADPARPLTAVHLGEGRQVEDVTLEEVVAQLKRDPGHPVRAKVGDLTIEVRAVAGQGAGKSAADVLAELGPWAGESTEEILHLLAEARRRGGQRSVPEL